MPGNASLERPRTRGIREVPDTIDPPIHAGNARLERPRANRNDFRRLPNPTPRMKEKGP